MISEVQVTDFDQSMDTEDNDNDYIGWRSLSDIVTTSEDSDSSNNDGTEWLHDSLYEQNHTIFNLWCEN